MKILNFFLYTLVVMALVITGCDQESTVDNPVSIQKQTDHSNISVLNNNTGLSKLSNETLVELSRVRSATAKYHNLDVAIGDGYADANVYEPHMGWHYLKADILDADFEIEKPELLVYAPWQNGELQLVAVEYAVPHALSADPPEGFTGDDDVWDLEPTFDLWTLHAWVWYNNPDGIFTPFNPRVD